MIILAIIIVAASAFLLRSEYEKNHFVTERYTIYSEKLKHTEQNFVFLSDLHNKTFGEKNEKLIKAIDEVKPDGVLIGGDMMICKGDGDLEITLDLVGKLAAKYPVYYGNGNHEERMRDEREIYGFRFEELEKALVQLGVHYLSDDSADFGSDIRITGCNIDSAFYKHRFTVPKFPEGEIKKHVGPAAEKRFQILLLHSPLFFGNCRKWGADLTLSGHFHGGTIRLPFLGGIMTPQYQFFLPWCAGRFEKEGKTMIVSRGLGTHSINIRFNDKPQLVWITLKSGKESAGKKPCRE